MQRRAEKVNRMIAEQSLAMDGDGREKDQWRGRRGDYKGERWNGSTNSGSESRRTVSPKDERETRENGC